jgi:hypothetical protein
MFSRATRISSLLPKKLCNRSVVFVSITVAWRLETPTLGTSYEITWYQGGISASVRGWDSTDLPMDIDTLEDAATSLDAILTAP